MSGPAALGCTFLALSLSSGVGCERKPDEKQERNEQKSHVESLVPKMVAEMADREQSDEFAKTADESKAERDALRQHPRDFFEVSGLRFAARSNNMHSVQALTLTNKSKFAVDSASVSVDYMQNGMPSANVELTLSGTLPAGATRTFSIGDNSLHGAPIPIVPGATHVGVSSVMLAPTPQASADISTL